VDSNGRTFENSPKTHLAFVQRILRALMRKRNAN
jgi:hypothetical protein